MRMYNVILALIFECFCLMQIPLDIDSCWTLLDYWYGSVFQKQRNRGKCFVRRIVGGPFHPRPECTGAIECLNECLNEAKMGSQSAKSGTLFVRC